MFYICGIQKQTNLNGADFGFNEKCSFGLQEEYYVVQIPRRLEESPWMLTLERDIEWYIVFKNAPEELFINALKNI